MPLLRRARASLPGWLRSLRARLLVATALIAVGAVGAASWLASQATTERLRDDIQDSITRDGEIYEELLAYASTYPTWDGVDAVVRKLADESGRRIVLTTSTGREQVIADSANMDGGDGPPLPRRPVAVVDPANPVVSVASESLVTESVVDMEEIEASDVPEVPAYTADELAEMDQAAEDGSRCLDAAGFESHVFHYEDGTPEIGYDANLPGAAAAWAQCVDEDRLYGFLEDLPMDESMASARPARLYLTGGEPAGLAVLDAGRGPTLVAGGIVALLAVGVTVLVSRRLLRPVVALTEAAQQMAAGDLSHRVDVRGRDELSELAGSFNTMAEALADHEEQRKRMVNDVAHELRNPLANIRGYVEAALDGVTLADDKLLGSLHEDALLLQRLVDDLQTLALAEAGRLTLHRKPTDVAELASTVVRTHQAQAEAAGISLLLDVQDPGHEPLVVDGDPGRLRQALGNLVSNAVRYSSAGDQVTVRVARQDGHAVIDVADTGIGIDADDLPHLFDRFWRADRSRTRDTGGSGLGLAITHELVTAHDGRVEVASRLGEGSTFTIRLPRVAASLFNVAGSGRRATGGGGRRGGRGAGS